ncbi:MAG: NAD-dependent epimerase/dehydratase family protein [Candidatus Eremiobacteraeota bacterium]|nr:NAD-dependent epimerase/dehydratase family protein [Candidatus Eremiobacteraeota bacterium]MCW5871869.1 NAD-dependent epimerase/dehydratase family protein [Candidatus Eremiobacteraeota bacterium]
MQVLVTGGGGFVGSHLVRALLSRGHQVRVLARSPKSVEILRDQRFETAIGDLKDRKSLRAAVKDCQRVFHCAADYRLWSRNVRELYENNVDGTENLLRACREQGVKEVVYTSSVAAIGIPKSGRPGEETTPVTLDDMIGHYKRSKFLAQQVAQDFAKNYPVYIVNPSTPIGSHDWKPTATGKIIVDFLNGKMPAFVDTGLNLVAVEDVVDGHLLAPEKGQPGRLYILGNQNMTLEQILQKLASLTQKKAPKVKLPYGFVYGLAWAENFLTGTLLKREPFIPLEGVKMARKRMWFSNDRAVRELGFRPTSVDMALQRAIDWYQTHGYAPL